MALRPRDDGYFSVLDPGRDKPISECSTLMCRHCGRHWIVKPGSGKKRGWCMRCNGPTCGPKCGGKCVPLEQLLENYEKGRPRDFTPVTIAVPIDLGS